MASHDAPLALYIAAYTDPDAAQVDWDAFKQLRKDKVIQVEGLVLVTRDAEGKIHEKDNIPNVGVGAVLGAAGGLLVGLIFPPSLLAAGAVGAGIGAGTGGLLSHVEKKEIKAEVADDLAPGSSGIVVLFDPSFTDAVDKALPKANKVLKHDVDPKSAEAAKAAANSATYNKTPPLDGQVVRSWPVRSQTERRVALPSHVRGGYLRYEKAATGTGSLQRR